MTSTQTIVLVTGANQGLGFEIVKKLAAENENYLILMGARSLEKVQQAASKVTNFATNTKIDTVLLDVTSDESINKAAQTVSDKYGHVDVLVNNAGIAYPSEEAKTIREQMHQILDVNTAGVVITTDAFAPLLKKSKSPRIVIMSSDLGSIGHTLNPDYAYYAMAERARPYKISKAGVNMAGAVMAAQYKEDGIRVNLVNPGFRATNLNNHAPQAGKAEDGAIEACKIITLGDDSATGTYTEMEEQEEVRFVIKVEKSSGGSMLALETVRRTKD